MEKNDDIARGYTKGDRVAVDAKWVELANDLNAAGPPVKDVGGWKKAWADWKTSIKKKLAHNKKESIATGGGPFNQMPLTDMETKIADLCGLFRMVDGIEGARSFGPPEQPIKTEATEESSQKASRGFQSSNRISGKKNSEDATIFFGGGLLQPNENNGARREVPGRAKCDDACPKPNDGRT
nr:uncharacterized protein LOC108085291 [Drosophila kikkawai]